MCVYLFASQALPPHTHEDVYLISLTTQLRSLASFKTKEWLFFGNLIRAM